MTLVVIPELGVYFASRNDAIILKPTMMGVSVKVAITSLMSRTKWLFLIGESFSRKDVPLDKKGEIDERVVFSKILLGETVVKGSVAFQKVTWPLNIIAIFVIVSSGIAKADWIKVEVIHSNPEFTLYVENTSRSELEHSVKFLALVDYSSAQVDLGVVYRSMKMEIEVDCKRKVLRSHQIVWHTENMGKGRVTRTFPNSSISSWQPISTNTFDSLMNKLSCASG